MTASASVTFVVAAKLKDIKEGCIKAVRLRGGYEVAIACQDGRLYAFSAYCPHQRWPLKWGEVGCGTLTCGLHAWTFDLETGAVLDPPMADCLDVYPVRVEGDFVYVGVPDPRR